MSNLLKALDIKQITSNHRSTKDMASSLSLDVSSPTQEAEIARRLQLLESRFIPPVPQRQHQQLLEQHQDNDIVKCSDSISSNPFHSNFVLLQNPDGTQHSFSFEAGSAYVDKENTGGTRSNSTTSTEMKEQQEKAPSETYKLVEKAAYVHIQKIIDEKLGRSNGSSRIVLESPSTSLPESDHCCSPAGDERKSSVSVEARASLSAPVATEDCCLPLVTANTAGKGRKSVPYKRSIVSVTDGTRPVSTGEEMASSSATTSTFSETNMNMRGSRKRTRLQYPQLAVQTSNHSTTPVALPEVVDSCAAAITRGGNEANQIGVSSKPRLEKSSPLSPTPSIATVPVEPSSSSRSNPPSTYMRTNKKSGPPPNNTSIHDFFKSSMKANRSPSRSPQKSNNSSPSLTFPPCMNNDGEVQHVGSLVSSDADQHAIRQTHAQMDQMRHRCETLEQAIKEKDEQLQIVHSNRTILHSSLKMALEKKEQELQDLRLTMEERLGAMEKVLEHYIRKDKSLEMKELRQSLASNAARLGRFVYTRTLHGTIESWESGDAMANLKKQREELKWKRDILEQRQKDAKKALKRVMKEQQAMDSMPPPPPVAAVAPLNGEITVVGGLSIQDELDVMEAEESVRMHLNTNKQQEIKLAEDEKALNAETAAHIRSLKRLANEDGSRFQKISKLNDRYTLICLLGKGGFSEVWQAYDSEKLREVAVKIHQIDPRWSDAKRENYTKHVSREYQIHRDVRHPRIVSLYDVFEIDSNSFATVLECCKGTDLDTLLKEKKSLPERDARAILLQILDGMRYLSSPSPDGSRQGIIHYDLKPGNILFDEFGDAKITDFGLSKIVDASDPAESMELTSQGAGTYWYLPPECFITNQSVRISNKVDVWSIGVIYYQMLFCARPFGDGMSQEKVLCNNTMLNAREVKFPPKPTVSNECMAFIQQCLTYDQTFRPTIAELCNNKYLFQKKL